MLLLRTERLPEGPNRRAIALKSRGRAQLRSHHDTDSNARYPGLVEALGTMPDETVLYGEIVALD